MIKTVMCLSLNSGQFSSLTFLSQSGDSEGSLVVLIWLGYSL